MCEGLYGDTSVASKVRCAYICDVDYTMTINYLGETETEDDKMSLICYKKGGNGISAERQSPNKTEPYMKTWHMLFLTQNTYAVFFS